jgi:peptide-methionine (S)-S-oxide reductase
MSCPTQNLRAAPRAARLATLLGALISGALVACSGSVAAERAVAVPAPLSDAPKQAGPPQTAVLAGGCFWGVQGVFEHLTGVKRVVAGYSGGDRSQAHYDIVGTGQTNHAESVEITYDPAQVSYGQILQVFFSVAHDPTQLNAQGPDRGYQYRSSIFFADEAQQKIANVYIAQLNQSGIFPAPIVTRVVAFKGFYPAEGYHQDFLLHNPTNAYIAYNDLPKIQNFHKLLPSLYQDTPVTLAPIVPGR